MYEAKLRLVERLVSQPVPTGAAERIEIVRQLNFDSGEGVGNVLDVIGVSGHSRFPTAQRLNADVIARLVGVEQPTLKLARAAVSKLSTELDRGECVCFPFYEAGEPTGWFFVGNTID